MQGQKPREGIRVRCFPRAGLAWYFILLSICKPGFQRHFFQKPARELIGMISVHGAGFVYIAWNLWSPWSAASRVQAGTHRCQFLSLRCPH